MARHRVTINCSTSVKHKTECNIMYALSVYYATADNRIKDAVSSNEAIGSK